MLPFMKHFMVKMKCFTKKWIKSFVDFQSKLYTLYVEYFFILSGTKNIQWDKNYPTGGVFS